MLQVILLERVAFMLLIWQNYLADGLIRPTFIRLEVVSCSVSVASSLVYGVHDFGVAPSCGESNSKSFTWAHKSDC